MHLLLGSGNISYIELNTISNNSFPKSFGKSHVATSHGREWTLLWRVLAVQCPLQMSSLSHWYSTSTVTDHDDGIYCTGIALRDKNTPNSNLANI